MPTTEILTIRAGGALVGPELSFVGPAEMTIEGGVITRIGSPQDRSDASSSRVVDIPEAMLVPGFIDAHVHIGFFEPRTLLEGGITTARDLGWPPEKIFPLVSASAEDGFDGPQVVAAGPMLTAPGGYPTKAAWAPAGTGLVVDSPEEAGRAVEDIAASNPSVVKVALNPPVGPTLDGETLSAIVQTAHDLGLRTTGHVYGLAELEKALDAGLDELAHMLMSPKSIPDGTIARMVTQGMRIVPTLSIRSGKDQKIAIGNLAKFIAAGGEVIYGTDLGNDGPEPGIDAREVAAMARAGMTSLDIIRSATVDSAAWLALGDRGYLAEGMRADVVGLPLSARGEPSDLTEVQLVVRAGLVREL